MAMRAGKMRHYADIEHFVQEGDGTKDRGQKRGSWQPLHRDVPMDIQPLGGALVEIKRQLVPKASHQVWLRWISGVEAGMRIRYADRYFNIGYVDEGDFRQHNLGLTCTESAGGTVNG